MDHFDLLAPLYDRLIGPPDPGVLQRLMQLPIPGRLLDVGGGTGRASLALRPLVGDLVISDLSAPMLRQAHQKGGLEAVCSHAERLPFPESSFDRLLVVDAFHHFHDQRASLAELLRVLRPGGRLVIEEPDIQRMAVRLIALIEKLALMRSHFYAMEKIRDMVAALGWPARIHRDGGLSAWITVDKLQPAIDCSYPQPPE